MDKRRIRFRSAWSWLLVAALVVLLVLGILGIVSPGLLGGSRESRPVYTAEDVVQTLGEQDAPVTVASYFDFQ